MEVLVRPSRPPGPAGSLFSRFSPSATLRNGLDRASLGVDSRLPGIAEAGGCKVYVAVGKSVEKAVSLLHWAFRRFPNREICILHVHQPSPLIPTLLGKLPASQASSEVVSAYRKEEREQTTKLLLNYLTVCCQSKVKASIIATEAAQVRKGVVDLVNKHGIRKLVMGAVPDNCMKVKRSSTKASHAAKYAPQFCEIWFVNKGKQVWMREASEGPLIQTGFPVAEDLSSRSFQCHHTVTIFSPEYLQSTSSRSTLGDGIINWVQDGMVQIEVSLPLIPPSSAPRCVHPQYCCSLSSLTSSNSGSGYTSSTEQRMSSDSESKVEEESLYGQLTEIRLEAEASKMEALRERLKRKYLEAEAAKSMDKVKYLESACAHEIKLTQEAEDAVKVTIQQEEKLLEEREEITEKLHKTIRNIALLDSRAQEGNHRCEEAANELKLLEASISTLRREKQRIRRQKTEAARWLDWWRNRGHAGGENSWLAGFTGETTNLAEFSIVDLQTATCNFSENFKIGQGGNGCVYKGEMLDRTVAIKKLHPHNMQGQPEFQHEVQVLGKLEHPHLVTLIGICPEAWSLVYEYLPNGSLQNFLFRKSNKSSLTWKIRARIVAEISSALLFLHSSKPESIVHGDLKPENILLDSELSCKLCDYGIARLMPEVILRCPSFRRYAEPKGAFPYTDPEFLRTGILTPKSDVYSFGMIILQLLTGRTPEGLASEVRKAVSTGKLASILNMSAGEWPTFVSRRLVDLGLQCCELNSGERPQLTPTLVRELEHLHTSEDRPVPSFFLCPILREIMYDPQVAADGFTYEGEALRGWLENGRKTSPMTNLQLDHLHLTPNHAIRRAIQDWLCKP